MTVAENADAETITPPKKRRLLPLMAALIAAIGLGGGSFYAVYSGLLLGSDDRAKPAAPLDMDFVYIPLENMTISLVSAGGARLLRFSGQIEVAGTSHADMLRMQPRFLDVVNTYLHALDPVDLEAPAALIRLRAQILRRLQIVAGDGHIRDFLITEFILTQLN